MNKYKGILNQSGIVVRYLLLVGLAAFFAIMGMALWTFLSGGNAADINLIKLLQFIQSLAVFVLPPLVAAFLLSAHPLEFLQLNRKPGLLDAGMVFLFMILIIPCVNLISAINQQLVLPEALGWLENWMKSSESQTAQLTERLLRVNSLTGLAFNVLVIAIMPALGEELFFRGAIQRFITGRAGAGAAIWIAAIIFSAIHIQFYGFVPRLLLGAFFGYLLVWSGSLWLPIWAHFINNSMAVLFYYLKFNGLLSSGFDIDTIGTGNTLWVGVVSGCLAILGVILIKKRLGFSSLAKQNR